MKHFIVILALVMTGCATTGKLESRMQARVGQNVNNIIDEIGPPTSSFKKPNGDTVYTWVNTGASRATAATDFGFNPHVQVQAYSCNVSYTAGADGVVKYWQYRGNACKAY